MSNEVTAKITIGPSKMFTKYCHTVSFFVSRYPTTPAASMLSDKLAIKTSTLKNFVKGWRGWARQIARTV